MMAAKDLVKSRIMGHSCFNIALVVNFGNVVTVDHYSRAHGAGALIEKKAPPCSGGGLGTTLGI